MNLGAAGWALAYAYVFLYALAMGLVLTPLARWLSHRVGMLDEPGERKIHAEPIPLLGGAAVYAAFAATILFNALVAMLLARQVEWLAPLAHGFAERPRQLAGVLVGGLLMLGLGMVDDKRDLSPAAKLAGQILIATLTVLAGLRLKLFIPSPWMAGAVTVLWIVAVTNAMNFFDNMDGACAGIGLAAALSFATVAGLHAQYLVCGLALAFAGSLAGFLVFNFHPAKIFLGDSGSHLVGYVLSVLAILPTFYKSGVATPLTVLSPLLVLGLPLFDMAAVVLIRWREGRPIYRGDTSHLSHRLAAMGLSQRVAVLILYGLQLVLSLGAMLLMWLPASAAWLVLMQGALVLLVVSLLQHYVKK